MVSWLELHPYEVVTILIVNYDKVSVENFVPAIQKSGLGQYVYTPRTVLQPLQDWPTLGEMISRDQRVVIFMDYEADQTAVPYVLDEFNHVWETPFSPTDTTFPCVVQRPPGVTRSQALDRLYLANHNLNKDVTEELGFGILAPDLENINQTNAVSGSKSLGKMASNCSGKR